MADNFANIKIGVDDDADQALKRINSAIKSVQSQVVNVKVQPNTDALKNLKYKQIEVDLKVNDADLQKIKNVNANVNVTGQASTGGSGSGSGSAVAAGAAIGVISSSSSSAIQQLNKTVKQNNNLYEQTLKIVDVQDKLAKDKRNLQDKINHNQQVYAEHYQDGSQNSIRIADAAANRSKFAQIELDFLQKQEKINQQVISENIKKGTHLNKETQALQKSLNSTKKASKEADSLAKAANDSAQKTQKMYKGFLKWGLLIVGAVKLLEGIVDGVAAFNRSTGSMSSRLAEAANAFADAIPIVSDIAKSFRKMTEVFVLGDTIENVKAQQDKLNKKANEKAKAVEAINKSVKDYVDAILFASNTFALSGDQAKIFQILEQRNKKIAQVLNSNNLSITQKQEALAKIFEASTKAAETASTVRDLGSAVSPQDDKARKELDALVAAQQAAMQASINRVLAINEAAVNTSASARRAQAELNKKIDDSQKLLNMALARQSFSGEQYADLSKGHQELLTAAKKQRAQATEAAAQRAKIQQDGLAQQASIQQELTKSITEKRQELNKKNIEAQKEAAEKAKRDLQASVAASIDDKNFSIDADPLAQRIKGIKKSMDDIDKSIEQAGKKGVDTSNLKSQAQIKRAQANKLIEDVTKKFTEQAIEKFTKTLEDTLNSNTGLLISGQKEVQQLRKLQQQIQKAKNPQSISTFQAQSINAQQEIAKEELKLKKKTSQQALKREQEAAKKAAKSNQQMLKIEEAFQAKRLAQSKLFASEQQKIALQKALQIAKLGEEQIKAEQDLAEKTKAVRDAFNSTIQSSAATSGLAARAGISKRIEQSVLETQKKALQQQKKANIHLEQIAKNKAVFAQ